MLVAAGFLPPPEEGNVFLGEITFEPVASHQNSGVLVESYRHVSPFLQAGVHPAWAGADSPIVTAAVNAAMPIIVFISILLR